MSLKHWSLWKGNKMDLITLKDITDDNLSKVIKIYDTLTDNQKKSVAPNYYSLSQAYIYRDIAWPKAIYNNEELVGFVMLGLDNYIADEKDCPVYFLWRFMIGKEFQGLGYGKRVLDILKNKCIEENINYLYVSCHVEESMPYDFYVNYGFIDTNQFDDDEKILKLKIK